MAPGGVGSSVSVCRAPGRVCVGLWCCSVRVRACRSSRCCKCCDAAQMRLSDASLRRWQWLGECRQCVCRCVGVLCVCPVPMLFGLHVGRGRNVRQERPSRRNVDGVIRLSRSPCRFIVIMFCETGNARREEPMPDRDPDETCLHESRGLWAEREAERRWSLPYSTPKVSPCTNDPWSPYGIDRRNHATATGPSSIARAS